MFQALDENGIVAETPLPILQALNWHYIGYSSSSDCVNVLANYKFQLSRLYEEKRI